MIDADYVTRLFGDDLNKDVVDLVVKTVNGAPESAQVKVEHTIYTETREALEVVRFRGAPLDAAVRGEVIEAVAAALRPFVVAVAAVSGVQGYDRGYNAALVKMLLDVLTKNAGNQTEDNETVLRA